VSLKHNEGEFYKAVEGILKLTDEETNSNKLLRTLVVFRAIKYLNNNGGRCGGNIL